MAIGDVIVGIDIGSSKISLVVGEVNNFNQIVVICNTSKKSNGIKKGKIVNEESLAQSITAVIKDAEKEMNMKINSAYITIPGKYVTIVQNSVVRDTKDKYTGISSKDVSNALTQAKLIDVPEGKQVIDLVLSEFILDDGKVVKDPIGSISSSFTLNAQIVLADNNYVRQMRTIFKKVDIDIDGMIPVTLAERNLVLEDSEKKDVVMLLDIGAQFTNIGVFNGEQFMYTNSIPIGGQNITNDLAICLNISIDEAEKLKKQYGLALKSYMDNDTEVVLNTCKDDNRIIKSSNVVEIIEARVEQIFDLVNKDISEQGIKQNINNVILTGQGITNINKSDIVAKITLNIPVKLSTAKIINLIKPSYQVAYSLIRYIALKPFTKNVASSVNDEKDDNLFKRLWDKIKDFFYS